MRLALQRLMRTEPSAFRAVEIAALANAHSDAANTLKLAEARIEELVHKRLQAAGNECRPN